MAHGGRALPPSSVGIPPIVAISICASPGMAVGSTWNAHRAPSACQTVLHNPPERCRRHVLVTPVERVGIIVEDAPFLAVEMADIDGPTGPSLAFRTNLDEIVVLDAQHPLRFTLEPGGGLKPYLRVRGDLWARLTRALALDLADRLVERSDGVIGLPLGALFFPVQQATRPDMRDAAGRRVDLDHFVTRSQEILLAEPRDSVAGQAPHGDHVIAGLPVEPGFLEKARPAAVLYPSSSARMGSRFC